MSVGANASIGPITNSGLMIGNVDIANQASLTVTRGSGKTFRPLDGRRYHDRQRQPHVRRRQHSARR
jgi:hypothetical protein